jgi:hypothetical protein
MIEFESYNDSRRLRDRSSNWLILPFTRPSNNATPLRRGVMPISSDMRPEVDIAQTCNFVVDEKVTVTAYNSVYTAI